MNWSTDGTRSEPSALFISSISSFGEARNRSENWADRARTLIDPGNIETWGKGWEVYWLRSWQHRQSHDEGSPCLSGSARPHDGPSWLLSRRLKSPPHAAFRKPLDGACGQWPDVLGGRPALGFVCVEDESAPWIAGRGEGEERGWTYLLCTRHHRARRVSMADRAGNGDGVEPAGHPVLAMENWAPWGRSRVGAGEGGAAAASLICGVVGSGWGKVAGKP